MCRLNSTPSRGPTSTIPASNQIDIKYNLNLSSINGYNYYSILKGQFKKDMENMEYSKV